jgi:anti-anti-sigma factor
MKEERVMSPSGQGFHRQVAVGDVVDGEVRVAVSGAVDFVTGDAAGELLREVVGRDSVSVLVLDLTSVGFCDCAGLDVLTRVRLEALRLGRRVMITAASPQVRWLLHVTGLAQPFGYAPDMSAAAGGDRRAHSTEAGGAADSSR